MQVTVEGGCHLGYDPSDPLANAPDQFAPFRSTVENSLVYQLDQHRIDPKNPLDGWALPDLVESYIKRGWLFVYRLFR
jgi:hypothetical protein